MAEVESMPDDLPDTPQAATVDSNTHPTTP